MNQQQIHDIIRAAASTSVGLGIIGLACLSALVFPEPGGNWTALVGGIAGFVLVSVNYFLILRALKPPSAP